MCDSQCVLELSDVTLFRGERVILRDVSWRVEPGEHWAVLGANGSGKTTLLRTAIGYLWPSRGGVSLLGEPLGEVELAPLRRQVGWVSSALHDWVRPHERALAVVLSGRFGTIGLYDEVTGEDVDQAHVLLADLDCRGLAESPWGVLSQGEQQKVMIARALLGRPRLLILDEPCAGLDLAAREALLVGVEQLAHRPDAPTLVLVTHHIEEITHAFTHALVLQGGRALAQGPKEEVLTGPVLSDAFGVPVRVHHVDGRFWPRVEGGGASGASST
jgi:iron complex transport system ATP-binding protein